MKRLLAPIGAAVLAVSPALAYAQEAPDPASLDAAKRTVDYVFPSGTYARIMDKTMDMVTGQFMDAAMQMPLRDLAAIGGLSEEELAEVGDGTLKEMMLLLDPHYEERMDMTMRTMMGEMGTLMTQFEPSIREGLASAYAKRFTPAQLGELNAFFATPTGGAYAADSFVIFMDPDVMSKMQEFMPVMMKEMPAIMKKVEAATAQLPKPRRFKDLSKAERKQMSDLLGIPEEELGKSGGSGLEPAG
jgi:hypothetical protein